MPKGYTIKDPDTGTCRGCGRNVLWRKTRAGKAIPLEPMRRVIITDDGDYVSGHEAHFATCPRSRELGKTKLHTAQNWREHDQSRHTKDITS